MTPLHTAACQGESDIARQLILKGASVFERDEEMSTPLHEAATVGDTKTAKIIFDACKDDVLQTVRVVFFLPILTAICMITGIFYFSHDVVKRLLPQSH